MINSYHTKCFPNKCTYASFEPYQGLNIYTCCIVTSLSFDMLFVDIKHIHYFTIRDKFGSAYTNIRCKRVINYELF